MRVLITFNESRYKSVLEDTEISNSSLQGHRNPVVFSDPSPSHLSGESQKMLCVGQLPKYCHLTPFMMPGSCMSLPKDTHLLQNL